MVAEYPFQQRKFQWEGLTQNYIDEGQGEVILCLHGNPSWSYLFRNIVSQLSTHYRVIAIDHIGCGLSDKPQDWPYTLESHILRLKAFVEYLELDQITLLAHDWGGAIGMGLVTDRPELFKRVILSNTAAFRSPEIPWQIALCKTPFLGEWFVRTFNGFARPATIMAVHKKMPREIKKGYLRPYNNFANRIATAKFVRDIPLNPKHQSYQTLKKIEDKLATVSIPVLLLWGAKDFCFTLNFFQRWLEFFPNAQSVIYPSAGHYLFEDEPHKTVDDILSFLKETPSESHQTTY